MFSLIFQGRIPLKPGEKFALSVTGDEGARVAIKCFVNYPPPPQYKECPECGEFNISADFPHLFTASESTFWGNGGGKLEFQATGMTSGTKQEFSVEVLGG